MEETQSHKTHKNIIQIKKVNIHQKSDVKKSDVNFYTYSCQLIQIVLMVFPKKNKEKYIK